MRILTALGIFILVTVSLIPISDALPIHSGNSEIRDSVLFISNNTTIGVPGFQTSFYLNNNITIPAGRVLTLLDLNVYVQIASGNITVNGSLRIINTSVHMFSSNESLNVIVHGTGNEFANFTMENSTWTMPGAFCMYYSFDRITNSSFSSGYNDPASVREALTIRAINSSLIAYNSTFSGLLHTKSLKSMDTSNLVYTKNVPFSSDNLMPLSVLALTTKDPIVTKIVVNLTFSGNNPTGENTLNFSYAGNFLSLHLGNTGSVYNTSTEVFNLPLSAPLSLLTQLIKSFTVSMYVANVAGSNSSIERLNISLLSNDTVSILGVGYFSYGIYNSSATFANSSIGVDMNAQYLYDNVMNPGHDFLYSVGSTIYILGSRAAGIPGNMTFYFNINSSILFFSHVHVNASTGIYLDSNFPLEVSSLTCSTYVLKVNDFVYSTLREINVSEGEVNNDSYSYYLLSDFIRGSNETYTGNYVFAIYNLTYEVALPQYNFSSMNNVNETFHTDLPILDASLVTRFLTMGTANSISLNISVIGCDSLDLLLEAYVNIGNGKLLTFLNKTENVNTPTVNVVASNIMIPYLSERRLTIIVHLLAAEPTYAGKNLTFFFAIPLIQNEMLNISGSYVWLRDQNQMLLTVNYSIQPGPFNFSLSENATINTLDGKTGQSTTYSVNSSNEKGTFEKIFYLTSIAENASIFVMVYNDSLLLTNASSTIHLGITGNASYYPNSTVEVMETGLPISTYWSITVGNESYSSIQSTLIFYVPNGVYNYSILQVPGFISDQLNGSIAAIYKEEYINISFSPYKYSIVIEEDGLVGNYTWSVIIENQTLSVNDSSLTLYLSNGTYNFSVRSSGFESQNESYTFFVSGSDASVHVLFVPIKHYSLLSTIFKTIYNSPFSYIGALVMAIVYLRFYSGSIRVCSVCLTPIRKGRMKCENCKILKK